MTDTPVASGSTFPTVFGSMSDSQLRNSITQMTAAASGFASPTPQLATAQSKTYQKNLHNWSTTTTPPPKNASSGTRSTRARGTVNRPSNLANTSVTPSYTPPVYQQSLHPIIAPAQPPNAHRAALPTATQALHSTYASRLRTGATLLMQPILSSGSATATRTATRRGGVVNYADPGSGDDLPDAGALDSDDSDFVASGGTRTSIRQSRSRMATGMSVFNSTTGLTTIQHAPPPPPRPEKTEIEKSYLGLVPPSRFIKSKPILPTAHEYPPPDAVENQAQRRTALVPIRVEFETDTHRVRDCFVWNLYETLIKPESFAKTFCNDLDLPLVPWAETVTNQIKAQLEDHEAVATMELGMDGAMDVDASGADGDDNPECRVILSIDVQIANHHLLDHIEWDLLSPLTPEAFASKLSLELGLTGEAIPLIAHAIHEELIKHKKDATEWGVIGGDREIMDDVVGGAGGGDGRRDRSGMGLVKDKTGLGLSWGRAPRDGRGPKHLKSVWRDWTEAEEFRTRFEVLSAEEVERREIEKERASRRLRRETSKFQSSTRSRRR